MPVLCLWDPLLPLGAVLLWPEAAQGVRLCVQGPLLPLGAVLLWPEAARGVKLCVQGHPAPPLPLRAVLRWPEAARGVRLCIQGDQGLFPLVCVSSIPTFFFPPQRPNPQPLQITEASPRSFLAAA